MLEIIYAHFTERGNGHQSGRLRKLDETIRDLLSQNRKQWQLEDISHSEHFTPEELARTKRLIDISNATRTQLIDGIDTLTHLLYPDQQKQPTVHLSETLGELIDRITILILKEYHSTDPALRKFAKNKRRHLQQSLDLTLRALTEGRASLPPSGTVKIYQPATEFMDR
ncbi:DUF4254 domain-containing protein [Streptomyces europaeiscabiei]|uniref:DUF4254 domain-containing protein n=1 Tax=Streptomyces europaeiscabiei TaxID=146819 RepID=A0ABU4NWI5_9ACTN|nr:DUF4254 domain-containing protein [Streptomyces europaeiscabiei]MDX3549667.1 DUF4254 domain-containing protein [Streptomyces europaeiscabiei]MDX3557964.1 DUF4254 domain-containing protein [Streptomyces europaeiscabiei]MDX3706956.1 DUF4254 domain-containing protein [Streptomyces europaeiscabiei]